MNCYLDSSIVLRKIFSQSPSLKEWDKVEKAFSSRLLRLECLRTIDRVRLKGSISEEETSARLADLHKILYFIGLIPMTEAVLQKAEQSLPTSLASLDSIHLATALLWREKNKKDFLFATHDEALAMAARAQGFEVMGV